MTILRKACLGSNFTGSYKKKKVYYPMNDIESLKLHVSNKLELESQR